MSHFKEKFSSKLTQTLSSDASIIECIFDGCKLSDSGGAVFVSGNFDLLVSHCLFLLCEASTRGGGLCADNSISNVSRTSFFSCTVLRYGSGTYQNSRNKNNINLSSYISCKVTGTNPDSYAAMSQRSGFSQAGFINGSFLYARMRESAYHHSSGPLSYIKFSTFYSCSGPFTISFHCENSGTQIQENICTSNSSNSHTIAVLYNGDHCAKNFVFCEEISFVSKSSSLAGSITFENSFFGCKQQNQSWLKLSDCRFGCNTRIIEHNFRHPSKCFRILSVPFTLYNLNFEMVPIVMYQITLFAIIA